MDSLIRQELPRRAGPCQNSPSTWVQEGSKQLDGSEPRLEESTSAKR